MFIDSHSGQFSSLLSESDLRQFVLDEGILLAFFAASSEILPRKHVFFELSEF